MLPDTTSASLMPVGALQCKESVLQKPIWGLYLHRCGFEAERPCAWSIL